MVEVVQVELASQQDDQDGTCSVGKEPVNRLEQALQDRTPATLGGILQGVKEEQRAEGEREIEETVDEQVGPETLVAVAVIEEEAGDASATAPMPIRA